MANRGSLIVQSLCNSTWSDNGIASCDHDERRAQHPSDDVLHSFFDPAALPASAVVVLGGDAFPSATSRDGDDSHNNDRSSSTKGGSTGWCKRAKRADRASPRKPVLAHRKATDGDSSTVSLDSSASLSSLRRRLASTAGGLVPIPSPSGRRLALLDCRRPASLQLRISADDFATSTHVQLFCVTSSHNDTLQQALALAARAASSSSSDGAPAGLMCDSSAAYVAISPSVASPSSLHRLAAWTHDSQYLLVASVERLRIPVRGQRTTAREANFDSANGGALAHDLQQAGIASASSSADHHVTVPVAHLQLLDATGRSVALLSTAQRVRPQEGAAANGDYDVSSALDAWADCAPLDCAMAHESEKERRPFSAFELRGLHILSSRAPRSDDDDDTSGSYRVNFALTASDGVVRVLQLTLPPPSATESIGAAPVEVAPIIRSALSSTDVAASSSDGPTALQRQYGAASPCSLRLLGRINVSVAMVGADGCGSLDAFALECDDVVDTDSNGLSFSVVGAFTHKQQGGLGSTHNAALCLLRCELGADGTISAERVCGVSINGAGDVSPQPSGSFASSIASSVVTRDSGADAGIQPRSQLFSLQPIPNATADGDDDGSSTSDDDSSSVGFLESLTSCCRKRKRRSENDAEDGGSSPLPTWAVRQLELQAPSASSSLSSSALLCRRVDWRPVKAELPSSGVAQFCIVSLALSRASSVIVAACDSSGTVYLLRHDEAVSDVTPELLYRLSTADVSAPSAADVPAAAVFTRVQWLQGDSATGGSSSLAVTDDSGGVSVFSVSSGQWHSTSAPRHGHSDSDVSAFNSASASAAASGGLAGSHGLRHRHAAGATGPAAAAGQPSTSDGIALEPVFLGRAPPLRYSWSPALTFASSCNGDFTATSAVHYQSPSSGSRSSSSDGDSPLRSLVCSWSRLSADDVTVMQADVMTALDDIHDAISALKAGRAAESIGAITGNHSNTSADPLSSILEAEGLLSDASPSSGSTGSVLTAVSDAPPLAPAVKRRLRSLHAQSAALRLCLSLLSSSEDTGGFALLCRTWSLHCLRTTSPAEAIAERLTSLHPLSLEEAQQLVALAGQAGLPQHAWGDRLLSRAWADGLKQRAQNAAAIITSEHLSSTLLQLSPSPASCALLIAAAIGHGPLSAKFASASGLLSAVSSAPLPIMAASDREAASLLLTSALTAMAALLQGHRGAFDGAGTTAIELQLAQAFLLQRLERLALFPTVSSNFCVPLWLWFSEADSLSIASAFARGPIAVASAVTLHCQKQLGFVLPSPSDVLISITAALAPSSTLAVWSDAVSSGSSLTFPCVRTLEVLLTAYPDQLQPYRLALLTMIEPAVPVSAYAHLLPTGTAGIASDAVVLPSLPVLPSPHQLAGLLLNTSSPSAAALAASAPVSSSSSAEQRRSASLSGPTLQSAIFSDEDEHGAERMPFSELKRMASDSHLHMVTESERLDASWQRYYGLSASSASSSRLTTLAAQLQSLDNEADAAHIVALLVKDPASIPVDGDGSIAAVSGDAIISPSASVQSYASSPFVLCRWYITRSRVIEAQTGLVGHAAQLLAAGLQKLSDGIDSSDSDELPRWLRALARSAVDASQLRWLLADCSKPLPVEVPADALRRSASPLPHPPAATSSSSSPSARLTSRLWSSLTSWPDRVSLLLSDVTAGNVCDVIRQRVMGLAWQTMISASSPAASAAVEACAPPSEQELLRLCLQQLLSRLLLSPGDAKSPPPSLAPSDWDWPSDHSHSLSSLRLLTAVAQGSSAALPRTERLIGDDAMLCRLVLTSAYAAGGYISACSDHLSLLNAMLECLPTSDALRSRGDTPLTSLASSLDRLELLLDACDVVVSGGYAAAPWKQQVVATLPIPAGIEEATFVGLSVAFADGNSLLLPSAVPTSLPLRYRQIISCCGPVCLPLPLLLAASTGGAPAHALPHLVASSSSTADSLPPSIASLVSVWATRAPTALALNELSGAATGGGAPRLPSEETSAISEPAEEAAVSSTSGSASRFGIRSSLRHLRHSAVQRATGVAKTLASAAVQAAATTATAAGGLMQAAGLGRHGSRGALVTNAQQQPRQVELQLSALHYAQATADGVDLAALLLDASHIGREDKGVSSAAETKVAVSQPVAAAVLSAMLHPQSSLPASLPAMIVLVPMPPACGTSSLLVCLPTRPALPQASALISALAAGSSVTPGSAAVGHPQQQHTHHHNHASIVSVTTPIEEQEGWDWTEEKEGGGGAKTNGAQCSSEDSLLEAGSRKRGSS